MTTAVAYKPVDVVVTPNLDGQMSIMIDPCLDSLRVGRNKAITEMLLPGYYTGPDSTSDQLQPEAAIIRQVYRITENNRYTPDLIAFLRDSDHVGHNGLIDPEGFEQAKAIKVTYRARAGLGQIVEREDSLFKLGMSGAKNAIVTRADGTVINPNVSFAQGDALASLVGLGSSDELLADSFYVPTPLASGALASCAASESKQSTKLRVLLPNGYEFLVAWFRLSGRIEALQSDKW